MGLNLLLGLSLGASRSGVSAELSALRSAMETATEFVVTGDSTRDNSTNRMVSFYYPYMLGKVGIRLIDNAASGLSIADWAGNTGSVDSADAIAEIPGDGSNVVWGFSLGINDVGASATETATEIYNLATPGIDAVLAAKPNVTLFLVQPVAVANSARNDVLNAAYDLLADNYGVHLVRLYQKMRDVYDGTGAQIYYADGTHPSVPGSMRAVNYILSDIAHSSQLAALTLDDRHYTGWTETLVRALDNTDITSGKYWNSSAGSRSNNANWHSFEMIAATNGDMLKVQHEGNRTDIKLLKDPPDADGGNLVRGISGPDRTAGVVLEYDLAGTLTDIGINVDSSGSYVIPGTAKAEIFSLSMVKQASDLTQAEINTGLSLRLTDTTVVTSGDMQFNADPMEWNGDQLIFNAA